MTSRRSIAALLGGVCLASQPVAAQTAEPQTASWQILEGLTTEVGPRLPGSEREAAARDWAVARLKALGLANVRSEAFTIPGWVRGAERAQLTAPFPHDLAITALGYSAPTPAGSAPWSLCPAAAVVAQRPVPVSMLRTRAPRWLGMPKTTGGSTMR